MRNNVIFHTDGYCKHPGCDVSVKIKVMKDLSGTIENSVTEVLHEHEDLFGRPIAGHIREELREKLADGRKAFKERVL